MFRLVGAAHAVQETRIPVGLHASLDAIEGESSGGGQDARHGGGNLDAVLFDEALGASLSILYAGRRRGSVMFLT